MIAYRKTILESKPPNLFPNCWFADTDENINDGSNIPSYDAAATKNSMDATKNLCESIKNNNLEDEDWESKISKILWTPRQHKLFNQIQRVLDNDHLARMAYSDIKRHEVVQRRIQIDKSAERMRKVLASFSWETVLIQWIHNVLMESLPPSYLSAYLDIMQALKAKIPSLVDKMIFWKPGNVNQDLLSPILKKPWQVALINKYRKLPGSVMLVVIPSASPRLIQSSRMQKLFTLFSTMAPVLPIQIPTNSYTNQQSLQSIAEQTVSITRMKIQELKAENPDRKLILIGLNSGSCVALQVSLVEQVSGVVSFGFSYNTVHGVRGQADDNLIESVTPTMFLIGQNSSRCNEEELEHFIGKYPTAMGLVSTVVVGSADDHLRVNKMKRRLEGVTQEMVDNMIVDEIYEFANKSLQRPLPKLKSFVQNSLQSNGIKTFEKKRKMSTEGSARPTPMKTQKLMRPTSTSDEAISMAVQSILPSDADAKIVSTSAPHSQNRLRLVPGGTIQVNKLVKGSQTQTKVYHVNTQRKPGASGQAMIRTTTGSRPSTPTGSQYVLKRSSPSQNALGSTTSKYTIVKPTKMMQYDNTLSDPLASEIPGNNIADMPIVFADCSGNMDEDQSANDDVISVSSGESPPGTAKQIVIKSSQISQSTSNTPPQFTFTKNKNILIQKPVGGKFVLSGTVIGKQVAASNIVLPKTQLTSQPVKLQRFVPNMKIVTSTAGQTNKTIPPSKKIEILNNQIIRPANSTNLTKVPSTSFINLADAKPISVNRLSLPSTSSTGLKNQIIIKTNALKPYTGTTIPSVGSKQLGNLTVRRVNVVNPPAIQKTIKKP